MRAQYEQAGIHVIELSTPDPHFKTSTFLQLPDGRTLAYYNVLYEIPCTEGSHLNEGEQFTMSLTALPSDLRYNGVRAAIGNYGTQAQAKEGELIVWLLWIPLIKLVLYIIGGVIIFLGTYFIIEKIMAPCGITGSEIEINECWKKVIQPNCSFRSFNSCAGEDVNGDGYPDGEWLEDSWQGGFDWIKWLIIGAVVIGGVYLAVKIIPGIFEKKGYPVQQFWPRKQKSAE